jgi:hypothetical protein
LPMCRSWIRGSGRDNFWYEPVQFPDQHILVVSPFYYFLSVSSGYQTNMYDKLARPNKKKIPRLE